MFKKNLQKRFIVLIILGVFILGNVTVLPSKVEASVGEDVMTLISSLLLQVQKLQEQLQFLQEDKDVEVVSAACPYVWSRYINESDYGTDVQDLQKFLNNYSEKTKVTYFGFGSKGFETPYFGKATGAAVKNFQAIYDIEESGFGPLTQAKAQQVCGSKDEVDPVPTTPTASLFTNILTNKKTLTLTVTASQNSNQLPTVCGPISLGSITWGDGNQETVYGLGCSSLQQDVTLTHEYKKDGSYTVTFTNLQHTNIEQKITLSSVPVKVTPYTIGDVASVTSVNIDPIKMAIDDEYTLYTISLKNGAVHKVQVNGMVPREYINNDVYATGYTGDVEALFAKAL